MPFKNYKQTNNAIGTLATGIAANTTTIILDGQGGLFPSTFPFLAKLEKYDSQSRVIKREIIEVTNRSGQTLTVTRSAGYCPADYTATTQTNTAFSFDFGDTITLAPTAEQENDQNTEIARLETGKINKSGGAFTGRIDQAKGVDIASATTTNLATATGNVVHITGNTTITAFGTLQEGTEITLIFDGILTLTYNATSLILPTAANIITQAGDSAVFVSEGAGKWKCKSYLRANGQPVGLISPTITGEVRMWSGKTAPTGFLLCDGSAVSRSTYATLFGVLNSTIGTFTVTIATPAVFTLSTHGLQTGDSVYLTTTGALPTGLAQNTRYWAIRIDANTFNLATSLANALAGTKINTSGSQSGTHTARLTPFGIGDGSTTFNVPNLKGTVIVGQNSSDTEFAGLGQTGGAKTHALTTPELASHSHGERATDSGYTSSTPWIIANQAGAVTGAQVSINSSGLGSKTQVSTDTAGSGTAHNNIQPYVTLNYIIAI